MHIHYNLHETDESLKATTPFKPLFSLDKNKIKRYESRFAHWAQKVSHLLHPQERVLTGTIKLMNPRYPQDTQKLRGLESASVLGNWQNALHGSATGQHISIISKLKAADLQNSLLVLTGFFFRQRGKCSKLLRCLRYVCRCSNQVLAIFKCTTVTR